MSSSLPSFHVLVLVLLALCTTGGVSGCSVTPSAAAVVAGDDLSLTCTGAVDSWRLESDSISATVLYQAASLYPDKSIKNERIVRDGFSVNDSNPRQVILTIIKASTVQANYYYCLCTSSAYAYVSVLASQPTFTNSTEITDGEPVTFTCSVSFNGTANTSIIIEDSSGNDLNTGNYDGASKGLHSFSLGYSTTANSSIYQDYFCNVSLSSDTSKAIIFSRKVNASITAHWLSVRNVQINPVDRTQCLDDQQCTINQKVRCTAEGNPKPVTFQWLLSLNGSRFNMSETSGDQFMFNTTGNYALQCVAFNEITGIRYNDSSSVFRTQVVTDRLDYPASGAQNSGNINSTPIIVGVVVGVGGFLIIILAIAIFLIVKRKKSRTVCCNPDDKETRSNQGVELSKHHNGNNSFSTDNGVQNKSFVKSGNDEVTLVDNDLYGKQSKTQIDPSDGGYASVNEVMQQSK